VTDKELMAAWTASEERLCGYSLHVWTWEDTQGVVHRLRYSQQQPAYIVRCTSILLGHSVRVPFCNKLPTCVWCLCKQAL
jgi:hypothetical protein